MATKTTKNKKKTLDYNSVLPILKRNQLLVAKMRGYELDENEQAFVDEPDSFDIGEYSATELLSAKYTKTKNGIVHTLEFSFNEDDEDLSASSAVDLIQNYREETKYYTVIFINLTLTSPARLRVLSAKSEINAKIEFWELTDLYINPFDHVNCPPHIFLSPEQIAVELPLAVQRDEKKRKIFISSLGGFCDDRVVKWYGAEVGDIFRIERESEYYGDKLPTYRVVRKVL